MVKQWDGFYTLGTLGGKGLTELLITRNVSPVFSENLVTYTDCTDCTTLFSL